MKECISFPPLMHIIYIKHHREKKGWILQKKHIFCFPVEQGNCTKKQLNVALDIVNVTSKMNYS